MTDIMNLINRLKIALEYIDGLPTDNHSDMEDKHMGMSFIEHVIVDLKEMMKDGEISSI